MTELLARGTVVLDGGLSNALEDRGHDLSSALWTARLLHDDPGEIVAVHRAYFAAGARVATTASYQANGHGPSPVRLLRSSHATHCEGYR
jgi:homocysteine S-methyltransferase